MKGSRAAAETGRGRGAREIVAAFDTHIWPGQVDTGTDRSQTQTRDGTDTCLSIGSQKAILEHSWH